MTGGSVNVATRDKKRDSRISSCVARGNELGKAVISACGIQDGPEHVEVPLSCGEECGLARRRRSSADQRARKLSAAGACGKRERVLTWRRAADGSCRVRTSAKQRACCTRCALGDLRAFVLVPLAHDSASPRFFAGSRQAKMSDTRASSDRRRATLLSHRVCARVRQLCFAFNAGVRTARCSAVSP